MKLQPSLLKKRLNKQCENTPISNVVPNLSSENDIYYLQETPAPEEAGDLLTDTKKYKEDLTNIFVFIYTDHKTKIKQWSIEPLLIKRIRQRKSLFSTKTVDQFTIENHGLVLADQIIPLPSFEENMKILRSQMEGETQPFPWFKTKNKAIMASNEINSVLKQINSVSPMHGAYTIHTESLYDVWSKLTPEIDTYLSFL